MYTQFHNMFGCQLIIGVLQFLIFFFYQLPMVDCVNHEFFLPTTNDELMCK